MTPPLPTLSPAHTMNTDRLTDNELVAAYRAASGVYLSSAAIGACSDEMFDQAQTVIRMYALVAELRSVLERIQQRDAFSAMPRSLKITIAALIALDEPRGEHIVQQNHAAESFTET